MADKKLVESWRQFNIWNLYYLPREGIHTISVRTLEHSFDNHKLEAWVFHSVKESATRW